MSRPVDSQEAQLGVLPLSQVAGSLVIHGVRLPDASRGLVAQVPDPVLGADSGTHAIVISTKH